MMRRCLFGVAVALVIAGSVTFAQDRGQGGGRVLQNRYTLGPVVGDVIADCRDFGVGDFLILEDWHLSIHDMMLLDQNGKPTQLIENSRMLQDEYYNSETGKRLSAGPGENQEMRMLFENGLPVTHRWSGAVFKVLVPGYGLVLSETGRATWQWDPLGGFHWLIDNSGHNGWVDRDLTALCTYLK